MDELNNNLLESSIDLKPTKKKIKEPKEKNYDKQSKIKDSYYKMHSSIMNNSYLSALRKSIILLLPVILIGIIAQILMNLPIGGYDTFIKDSGFNDIFLVIESLTLGSISLYLLLTLSYRVIKNKTSNFSMIIFTVLMCLITFIILLFDAGETELIDGIEHVKRESNDHIGFESLYLVIILCYFIPKITYSLTKNKKSKTKIYSTEFAKVYHDIMRFLLPAIIILIPTIIIRELIEGAGYNSINEIIVVPFKLLFENTNIQPLNGVLYTLFDRGLMFVGYDAENAFNTIELTGIMNHSFFEYFIFQTLFIGFFVSYSIFTDKKKEKYYSGIAGIPSLISINTPACFGFSMVLNPFVLIPFIVAPILTTLSTYFIFNGTGITPIDLTQADKFIFISGYVATNSWIGICTQIGNIVISALCFIPFILLNNYSRNRLFNENVKKLYSEFEKAKEKNDSLTIFDFDYQLGDVSKFIALRMINDMKIMTDVRKELEEVKLKKESMKPKDYTKLWYDTINDLKMKLKIKSYFQPIVSKNTEYNDDGEISRYEITGMECLMRYYVDNNYIIPPLALDIMRQAGLEYEINYYLWENMLLNVDRNRCKSFITFNISMMCLENDKFVDDLLALFDFYEISPNGFVIEITEEDQFTHEDIVMDRIKLLKEKGFSFAIDDYGAGQTSMKYFQTNAFELVKIDGDLVRKARTNEQIFDIIGNIKDLGRKTGKYSNITFKVLCEFIEEKEMFEKLKELKVDYYQGYLFGKAMTFDEIVEHPMMPKGRTQKHI